MKEIMSYITAKTHKGFATAMILFSALPALAQEEVQNYSFSLDEAIQHALQYNYTVINSERDIEAANKKKWETIATGLPQIDASGNYTKNFEVQKKFVTEYFFV